VADLLRPLDHAETRAAVTAERALLAALEGGCQVPLGAWARFENNQLILDACVLSPDGTDCVRDRCASSPREPDSLGRLLARKLLDAGAARILQLAGRTPHGR
jgi:hydroxymethylbilane synthase